MNLHHQARADVQRILTAHGTWLSGFRGLLDLGVQDAGGYWEPPNVDFVAMDPCVRSGHVRQFTAGQAGQLAGCQSPLRLRVTSFAGLHLYTSWGADQDPFVAKEQKDRSADAAVGVRTTFPAGG